MDGLLLIDKPKDWTSFDVVAKVRSLVRQQTGLKKCKVGHCGTLDPLATGLLLVVVGTYCKRAESFTKLDKSYTATLALGYTSTTGDEEGEKTAVNTKLQPSREIAEQVVSSFLGAQSQTPPQYSAIKIGGTPAYKLARAGKTAAIKPRDITVHTLTVQSYEYPYLEIECLVSSGTYIRVLAEDIGSKLGTGAYLSGLRRLTVGAYSIEQAINIEDLDSGVEGHLLEID